MSIYIFTDGIKSGKTTRLEKWIADKPGSDGILAPNINGKKHLRRIKTGEIKLLEFEGGDQKTELTKICNYNFIKSIFDWGQKELRNAYFQKPAWLIIDEIGPLELRGEALEPEVSKILNESNRNKINIILVVRKTLVAQVIEHYKLHIKGYKLFNI